VLPQSEPLRWGERTRYGLVGLALAEGKPVATAQLQAIDDAPECPQFVDERFSSGRPTFAVALPFGPDGLLEDSFPVKSPLRPRCLCAFAGTCSDNTWNALDPANGMAEGILCATVTLSSPLSLDEWPQRVRESLAPCALALGRILATWSEARDQYKNLRLSKRCVALANRTYAATADVTKLALWAFQKTLPSVNVSLHEPLPADTAAWPRRVPGESGFASGGSRPRHLIQAVKGPDAKTFLVGESYGGGMVGDVFAKGTIQRRNGSQIDEALKTRGVEPQFHILFGNTRAAMSLPIVVNDTTVAVLNLEAPHEDLLNTDVEEWTKSAVEILAPVFSRRHLERSDSSVHWGQYAVRTERLREAPRFADDWLQKLQGGPVDPEEIRSELHALVLSSLAFTPLRNAVTTKLVDRSVQCRVDQHAADAAEADELRAVTFALSRLEQVGAVLLAANSACSLGGEISPERFRFAAIAIAAVTNAAIPLPFLAWAFLENLREVLPFDAGAVYVLRDPSTGDWSRLDIPEDGPVRGEIKALLGELLLDREHREVAQPRTLTGGSPPAVHTVPLTVGGMLVGAAVLHGAQFETNDRSDVVLSTWATLMARAIEDAKAPRANEFAPLGDWHPLLEVRSVEDMLHCLDSCQELLSGFIVSVPAPKDLCIIRASGLPELAAEQWRRGHALTCFGENRPVVEPNLLDHIDVQLAPRLSSSVAYAGFPVRDGDGRVRMVVEFFRRGFPGAPRWQFPPVEVRVLDSLLTVLGPAIFASKNLEGDEDKAKERATALRAEYGVEVAATILGVSRATIYRWTSHD